MKAGYKELVSPFFQRLVVVAGGEFPGGVPSVKLLSMNAAEEKTVLSDKPMTLGASKHSALALALFLLAALIALAPGLAGPASASAKTPGIPQNRVWENSAATAQSRPIQMPQSLELQRENSIGRSNDASGCTLAAENEGARFGNAVTNNYRATFFAANPELEGQVVVHHAVEQQVLTRFPGVVTEGQIHSLENPRGIPNEINPGVHLSQIRIEWNRFYKPFIESRTAPTQAQLLQKATEIDAQFGSQFRPSAGGE